LFRLFPTRGSFPSTQADFVQCSTHARAKAETVKAIHGMYLITIDDYNSVSITILKDSQWAQRTLHKKFRAFMSLEF